MEFLNKALNKCFDLEIPNNQIKFTIINLYVDKIKILKSDDQNDMLLVQYRNLADILFGYLDEPDLMINNEKLFLNPLKKFIEFLKK